MSDSLPTATKERSSAWRGLLHQEDGPLTRELLLSPGGFGLGQVPAGQVPDAITKSICGFCSTGCALDIHLQEGQAISLTPSANYPVNLGLACPKGWEALTVLKSKDRATTPLVRQDRGRATPTDWNAALTLLCRRFREIQEVSVISDGHERQRARGRARGWRVRSRGSGRVR